MTASPDHLASFSSFLKAREELIADERSLRRDHQANIRPIGEDEKRADKILREIRADEAKKLWKDHHDPLHRYNEMYPGIGFLTGEELSTWTSLSDCSRSPWLY